MGVAEFGDANGRQQEQDESAPEIALFLFGWFAWRQWGPVFSTRTRIRREKRREAKAAARVSEGE